MSPKKKIHLERRAYNLQIIRKHMASDFQYLATANDDDNTSNMLEEEITFKEKTNETKSFVPDLIILTGSSNTQEVQSKANAKIHQVNGSKRKTVSNFIEKIKSLGNWMPFLLYSFAFVFFLLPGCKKDYQQQTIFPNGSAISNTY